MKKGCVIFIAVSVLFLCYSPSAVATDDKSNNREARIRLLEEQAKVLMAEIETLKKEEGMENVEGTEITEEEKPPEEEKIRLGGYGEIHANIAQGKENKYLDFHRFVLYLGINFSDWIRFHSETEIEHAATGEEFGGEASIEQAYVDLLLSSHINLRFGRILTPIGITNQKHEPPALFGVERSLFDTYIIPTTWPSDGVGAFGNIGNSLTYETYIVGGLDGSKFSATDGIREGRNEERPSLNEPSITGRFDYYPLINRQVSAGQDLRMGLSFYGGGLDNGNKGVHNGISGNIKILSTDFEVNLRSLILKGVAAREWISGAGLIGNGAASEIFGYSLTTGYRFWPDALRKGKLEKSSIVAFLRFDRVDTQFKMPDGIDEDPYAKRWEWTSGLNFYLTPVFVFKADYQWKHSKGEEQVPDTLNLGFGFQF